MVQGAMPSPQVSDLLRRRVVSLRELRDVMTRARIKILSVVEQGLYG